MNEKAQKSILENEIYEKMLRSAIVLRNKIRYKHKNNLEVTIEEANFVNDFEPYLKEVFQMVDEQEILMNSTHTRMVE